MSGGAAGVKAAVGTFIVFGFLTWISACIGIAGLQRSCWDLESLRAAVGRGDNWFEGLPLTGIRGFSRSLGCNAVYGCYWWSLAFEFAALTSLACFMAAQLLAASAVSWMGWFAVLALLWMQGSDSFLSLANLSYNSNIGYATFVYARLAAAGWIMTTIVNLGIVFALGWRPRRVVEGLGAPGK